jgi:hypothetical protein
MSIEFRCSQCGKLLRTDDGTTGRQAQCPECGAVSTVPPSSMASSEPSASPFAPQEGANPFGASPVADAGNTDNPYQAPVSPTYLPPGQVDPFAAQRVAGPATALIVTAILAIVLQVGATIVNLAGVGMGHALRHNRIDVFAGATGGIHIVSGLFGVIIAVVVLLGAMRMKRLENYGFAMASAILAMIPCFWPCCLLGLPFGIWALVVLSDGSVKAAFRS